MQIKRLFKLFIFLLVLVSFVTLTGCNNSNNPNGDDLKFDDLSVPLSMIDRVSTSSMPGDPTAKRAIMKAHYSERIKLLERIALETDNCLHNYILKAVTEGRSYTYLKTVMNIPCGRDMYYDRYRKFFWLLDRARD